MKFLQTIYKNVMFGSPSLQRPRSKFLETLFKHFKFTLAYRFCLKKKHMK